MLLQHRAKSWNDLHTQSKFVHHALTQFKPASLNTVTTHEVLTIYVLSSGCVLSEVVALSDKKTKHDRVSRLMGICIAAKRSAFSPVVTTTCGNATLSPVDSDNLAARSGLQAQRRVVNRPKIWGVI